MNSLPKAIQGGLATLAFGLIGLTLPAQAQQGWSGYGNPPAYYAPPTVTYTYPAQGTVWQGYAPGTAWSGPAYATTGPAVATTVPAQPVAAPAPGWAGYNPSAAWTGYAPGAAWTGYAPGSISVAPRQSSRAPSGLIGWGWTGNGSYREPGTGRKIPMLKPWIPGAAGS